MDPDIKSIYGNWCRILNPQLGNDPEKYKVDFKFNDVDDTLYLGNSPELKNPNEEIDYNQMINNLQKLNRCLFEENFILKRRIVDTEKMQKLIDQYELHSEISYNRETYELEY